MDIDHLIKYGILAGLIISTPKGPAGFYTIQQNIFYGFIRAFTIATGLIATTFVSSLLVLLCPWDIIGFFKEYIWIGIGALVILTGYIVVKLYQKKVNPFTNETNPVTAAKYLFWITLLTPEILLGTAVLFKALSPQLHAGSILEKSVFLGGVITGAVLWYVGVGIVIYLARHLVFWIAEYIIRLIIFSSRSKKFRY